MKFTLTNAQVENLMIESSTFRHIMIEKYSGNTLENIRGKIRNQFLNFSSNQKVAAIKWLREETAGKDELKEFERAGYEVRHPDFSIYNQKATLGLAAAKRFVEEC